MKNQKMILMQVFIFSISFLLYSQEKTGEQKITEKFKEFTKQAKKAWNGAGDMLKGVGQSFGYVTPDYHYSYRVFNDAAIPIFIAQERLTGFLGATFQGKIVKSAILGPYSNSVDMFYDQQLYFNVWLAGDPEKKEKYPQDERQFLSKWGGIIGAKAGEVGLAATGVVGAGLVGVIPNDKLNEFFGSIGETFGSLVGTIVHAVGGFTHKNELGKYKLLSKTIYPWQPKDDKIYYYRAYTYKGELKAEYLDLKGTTPEFAGQFFNNTKKDVLLKFKKNNNEYTVTLQPDSFNMLESTKDIDHSIRPPGDEIRGFQFFKDQATEENKITFMPLAPEGIGNLINKSKDPAKPELEVVGSMLYTYAIYDLEGDIAVGMQGLAIGNFDQPTSGNIRDINPARCHIWYKSAAQAQAILAEKGEVNSATVPIDLPEQVWITYKTDDYTFLKKINPSEVLDFTLLRPQIKEKNACLYVLSLKTDDDKKAQLFIERLHEGLIGQGAIFTDVSKPLDKKNILSDINPNQNGIIIDMQDKNSSGISGIILLSDQFLPAGVDDGPFFYIIEPSLLRVDQFANVIWFNKEAYTTDQATGAIALKSNILTDLGQRLSKWINDFKTKPDQVRKALEIYLKQNGNEGLFTNPTAAPASRNLTTQGTELLETLILGPVSIEKYPILRKSGLNYYVFGLGDKPKEWPS
ncbi:MAG: hypothetical protein WDZ41_01140 [Candidatus Babeliales bacterium]